MINKQLLKFQGDYENQYITDKNEKSKKTRMAEKSDPIYQSFDSF